MNDNSSDRNLVEQLAADYMERMRVGELVSIDDYAADHPDLAAEIHELFPVLEMMEGARPDDDERVEPFETPDLDQLGDYRILREIGRGGMGIVYEAVQESLNRLVALKVLPGNFRLDQRRYLRFQNEARSVGSLHHSNIVPVYGVGEDQGLAFYAMQYIHGSGLDSVIAELRRVRAQAPTRLSAPATQEVTKLIRDKKEHEELKQPVVSPVVDQDVPAHQSAVLVLAPGSNPKLDQSSASADSFHASVARIGLQVASALAHAHRHNVLHRDIKPSNLMLDSQGAVWLTDFGLAKSVHGDDGLTQTGEFVGTLRYSAPEQLRGEGDARSDICALGLTLYEMLTLRQAYEATDQAELLRLMTESEPQPLRAIDPRIPRDLETIILKATSRDPDRRYVSADKMEDDLQRFLNDEAIHARRESPLDTMRRWNRRNPVLARSLVTIGCVILLALFGVTMMWLRADVQRKRAQEAERRERNQFVRAKQAASDERTARLATDQALYTAHMNLVQQAVEDADPSQAREYLRRHEPDPTETDSDRRGFEWYHWNHRAQRFRGSLLNRQPISGFVFAPDGNHVVTGDHDGKVLLWSLETWSVVREFVGHLDMIGTVAFDSTGERLVTSSRDGTLRVWDFASASPVHVLKDDGPIRAAQFSPNNRLLASCGTNGRVRIWDSASGELLSSFDDHDGDVYTLAFSPDGEYLASGSRDQVIKIWNLLDGKWIRDLSGHTSTVRSLEFSPDGNQLASGGYDGKVMLWDWHAGELRLELAGHTEAVYAVRFSPNGDMLASSSRDDKIHLWNVDTGNLEIEISGHTFTVYDVQFSPDGKSMASASHDKTLKLWSTMGDEKVGIIRHDDGVQGVDIHPDSTQVATACVDGGLRIWDATTGMKLQEFEGSSALWYVQYDRTGQRIVAAGPNSLLKICDLDSGEQTFLSDVPAPAYSAIWSPDQKFIAASFGDGSVRVFGVEDGKLKFEKSEHRQEVYEVAYSPDGAILASAGGDGKICLWSMVDGTLIRSIEAHVNRIYALCFAPDGSSFVSGGQDRVIRVWSSVTGDLIRELRGHAVSIQSLGFADHGLTLASGSTDTTVKLWDAITGELKSTLRGHELPVHRIKFSPQSDFLASASADHTLRLWHTKR